jgi:putative transposase
LQLRRDKWRMRKPRLVLPDRPHHIMLSGNNQRRLFSFPNEYERFVFILARGLQQSWVELHALVLMTDHVQMIVTPPTEIALSKFVKYTAQRYAQSRNQSRDQSGRLFEECFPIKIIRSEQQLALTTAYLELGPVRAGLVKRPGDYSWSTYGLHAHSSTCRIPRELWTPTEWYADLGRDKQERERIYAGFAQDTHDRGRRPDHVHEFELREAISSLNRPVRVCRPDGSSAR